MGKESILFSIHCFKPLLEWNQVLLAKSSNSNGSSQISSRKVGCMNSSQLKSHIIKIIILLGIAGILVLLNKLFFHIKPSNVADWMEDLGFWAPIIFLLIFTIRPFTLVPLSIIAVACGIVFGPYIGSIYIVIGTVLGGTASFFALKYISKEIYIQDKNKENVCALKSELEKNGFKSVLMLRLIPAINFDLLTYICAKTQVVPWKYIAATTLGTIPGSIMMGFFGSSLLSLKPMNLAILAGIIILLIVLGVMMKKNVSKKYNTEKLKEEIKDLRKSA